MDALEMIYEDEHMIAVLKPSGLLVHPSAEARDKVTAMSLVRDTLRVCVHPVHRLDRATSGVLVFAKHPEAATALCSEFAALRTEKTYVALVRGIVSSPALIDHPLVEAPTHPARAARTHVAPLLSCEVEGALGGHATVRSTLCVIRPEQGRRHQIRKHLKHVFHPIIGDTCYGDGRHNRFYRERFGAHRLMLHAAGLRIQRFGKDGEIVDLRAAPPRDFLDVLLRMGTALPEFW